MFDNKQISYMKELGLKVNFENPSLDDWGIIEEAIADRLSLIGFDENYNPTLEGSICETIMDLVSQNA